MRKFAIFGFLLLSIIMTRAQQVVITDDASYSSTNSSALLEVHAKNGNMGILIPTVSLTSDDDNTTISNPVDGLLVFHDGSNGMQKGFYFWSADDKKWNLLYSGNVPDIPGNTVYWVRPDGANYILPEGNDNIHVYDAGSRYGVWYDGGTNQYAFFARTSNSSDTTAAVVGFSDVEGNQTYGYLGYSGTYTAPSFSDFGSVYGASVYGVVDDPGRTSGFFRTTGNASYAANIAYSHVWIAGYFYADDTSTYYDSRPALYGEMNVDTAKYGFQSAVKGISFYNAYSGNLGYTNGGDFAAISRTQDAIGVYSYAETKGTTAYGAYFIGNNTEDSLSYGVYSEAEPTGYVGDYLVPAAAGVYGWCEPSWWTSYDRYQFGVAGIKAQLNYDGTVYKDKRSAGVFGATWEYNYTADTYSLKQWGALGYTSSVGNYYGVYGTTNYNWGGGKSDEKINSIGLGAYGNLLGGWIKGEKYGAIFSGQRYATYIDGKQYTNDIIVQMNENDDNERFATYVPTSMSVDVIMRGKGKLNNGKAFVKFSPEYSKIISEKEPIFVTVTPNGKSNGVYVENVKANGFTVIENNGGKSNVEFTWIAIATRKGYEQPQIADELKSPDFDTNINKFMFNESDTTSSALQMYWQNNALHFEQPAKTTKSEKLYIPDDVRNEKLYNFKNSLKKTKTNKKLYKSHLPRIR